MLKKLSKHGTGELTVSDKLKCRRCRKVSEREELKKVQKKDWIDLVCPNCNCKNFNLVEENTGG